MTKAELRKKYKLLRKNLSVNDTEDLSLKIANQVLKLPIWEASFYHIFLCIEEQKEVNTDYILNILSGKDKNILVPKSDFKTGNMTHFLLTDSTKIKKNPYNIPEPVEGIEIAEDKIDVVFVPLLPLTKAVTELATARGFTTAFWPNANPKPLK